MCVVMLWQRRVVVGGGATRGCCRGEGVGSGASEVHDIYSKRCPKTIAGVMSQNCNLKALVGI